MEKIKTVMLIFFSAFILSGNAQIFNGAVCSGAAPFTLTNTPQTVDQTNSDGWLSFVANTTDMSLTLQNIFNGSSSGRIVSAKAYSGTCSNLVLLDADTLAPGNDSMLVLGLTGLTVGNSYFIYTQRSSFPQQCVNQNNCSTDASFLLLPGGFYCGFYWGLNPVVTYPTPGLPAGPGTQDFSGFQYGCVHLTTNPVNPPPIPSNYLVCNAALCSNVVYLGYSDSSPGFGKAITGPYTVNVFPSSGANYTVAVSYTTALVLTPGLTYTIIANAYCDPQPDITGMSATDFAALPCSCGQQSAKSSSLILSIANPPVCNISVPSPICANQPFCVSIPNNQSPPYNITLNIPGQPGAIQSNGCVPNGLPVGTYSVIYTAYLTLPGGGVNPDCFCTTYQIFNVGPDLPTPSVQATSTNICFGSPTTLSASINYNGSVTYTWLPPNIVGNPITVSPSVSTVYTVIAGAGACTIQNTIAINVYTVEPTFTANLTDPFICIPKGSLSATTEIIMSPPGNYILADPNSPFQIPFTNNIVLNVNGTTNFTVSQYNNMGCLTSTVVTVTQVPCACLAVNAPTIGGLVSFTTFPNLFTSKVKVVSDMTLTPVNVGNCFQFFSQIVSTELICYPGVKITLSSYPQGTVEIIGSYFHGCGEMWQGLVAPYDKLCVLMHPYFLPGQGVLRDNLIEDARVGLEFTNQFPSGVQCNPPSMYLEAKDATFNKCITGIKISNHQDPNQPNSPYRVENCLFTSRDLHITQNVNPNVYANWPLTNTVKNLSSGLTSMETPHMNSAANAPVQIVSQLYGYSDFPTSGIELNNVGFTDVSQNPPGYKGVTLGQPGNPNFNCFDHLQTDILLTNSNAKIYNSVFQFAVRNQKTNNLTGGTGISATSTGGNKNQLIVSNNSGNGNASFPCFFYDKTTAIDAADYHDVEVTNASFYSVLNNYLQFLQGNTFGGKGVNVQTNRYLRIFANNNAFYNIKNAVMVVINNQLQHRGFTREVGQISVDNNSINRWNNIPIPPSVNPYVNIGVYVADPINVPGVFVTFNQAVSVDVSNNTFNKVHNGISSVNFAYTPVSVHANTMTLLNQPIQFCSINCLQRGIFAANQIMSTGITLNSITGPAFVWGDSLKGISTANNMSLAIRCNTTANTARGIEFNGREAIDFYEDNSMIGSTIPNPAGKAFGHVLDNNATLNATGFIVGSAGRPTNNIWQEPWPTVGGLGNKTATYGSKAKNARMYIQFFGQFDPSNSAFTSGVGQPPVGPDQYTYSVNYSNTFWTLLPANILPPVQYGCRIGQGGGGGGAGQVALLEQIAGQGLNYQNNQVQNTAIDEHFAYRAIKANPSVMVNSQTLTTFYANGQTSNLQGMAGIEENLANNNLNNAQSQINAFTPANNVESNHKSYYKILKNWKDSTYSQNDSLSLITLANSCPYYDGMVVYQAQTLYNAIYRDYFKFYENCSGNNQQDRLINLSPEEKKTENYLAKSAIFPNPNNGNFVLTFGKDAEKQNAEITIFDLTGRQVYSENRQIEGDQQMSVGNNLLNGTYLVKIKFDDGTSNIHKLVISK